MTDPAMTASSRLAELGITIPEVVPPVAAYQPAVRAGGFVHTAGQLPFRDGVCIATGKVGDTITQEVATECARQAALNALAAIANLIGDLDQIKQIVKVVVFVASTTDFTNQPMVANGASEFLGEIFGEKGRHARSAVGVGVLPLDAPVEVELVMEI